MDICRRLPLGWKIALPIVLLVGLATALAIWHDNLHPESDHVARMAKESIATETGRAVDSVRCPRQVDFDSGDQLRCTVTFADGTTYVTTATIYVKPGPGIQDYVDAHFTLPSHAVPMNPDANLNDDAGASDHIQACVAEAGKDPTKLQACVP